MQPQTINPSEQVAERPSNRQRDVFLQIIDAAYKHHQVKKNVDVAKGAISNCLWAIGDALIAEVGAPGKSGEHTGSDAKLKQAKEALEEAGYHYSWERLRDFRQVANNFSLDLAGGRPPAWVFSLCEEAGDQETFNDAAEDARKKKVKLTVSFIEKFKKKRRREEDEKQRKQHSELNGRPPTNAALVKALKDYRKGLIAIQDRFGDNERIIKPHLAEMSDEEKAELLIDVHEVKASWQRAEQSLQADSTE